MLEVLPQPPPPSAARLATAALLAALAAFASAEPADDGPSPGASPVLEPGQTTVRARYWTGAPALDPALYTVDAGGSVTASDLRPSSALAGEMRAKFDSAGVVHVTNTGLADMGLQRELARLIMGDESEYEGGANPRGRSGDLGSVYDIGAPLEAALAYHHEMTYKSHSVETLGFLCKSAVDRGTVGWSFVSDSVQAHDYIMGTPLGRKLKEKGLCFVRRMTDAEAEPSDDAEKGKIYNHWQQSWMTDDPAEAQHAAEEQGLTVEWDYNPRDGRIMKTRYYKSAFEYVPSLDRNIMVTSIADDGEWFDSWPGIMDVPHEDRPLEMFFGDDEPFTLEEKQLWTDAYDRFGVPLPWKEGDVAVIDNMRFAHGRPGVELLPGEERELGVMLGKFYELQEDREDKWAEELWTSPV
mmetsp:Transcript_28857/g.65176  ORF Transcript_28857/g.65176 Transcript_28857/m.65176 type:complete len:411 (-) Transcript_28857:63-1295(-)